MCVAQRKRRARPALVVIPVSGSLALSTLGDDTVLTTNMLSGNLTEDFFVISTDISMSLRGLTAGQGDPMTAVIAHGDYTDAEILEGLKPALLGPGGKIEQERSRRLVRKVGVLQQQGVADDTFTSMNMIGKDGSRIVRTKCRFTIESGKDFSIGVWNRSGGALATGAQIEWAGEVYGRWRV